ncbi:MAG: helix-turn-helix transcriptional regulator, partial [Myxococcota bacterium]
MTWERIIEGSGYAIGEFHCLPDSPDWARENHITEGHLVVFPGTAVEIERSDHVALVSNPNHVLFYNCGQPYRRRLIDPGGDHCVFIRLEPADLAELIAPFDARVRDRMDAPHRLGHGPVCGRAYLRHLEIYRALASGSAEDADLAVHESLLALCDQVIRDAYRARGVLYRPRPLSGRDIEIARELQRVLSVRYAEDLRLDDLADMFELSASYLSRIFRRHTGVTIHAYRTQLRLV